MTFDEFSLHRSSLVRLTAYLVLYLVLKRKVFLSFPQSSFEWHFLNLDKLAFLRKQALSDGYLFNDL